MISGYGVPDISSSTVNVQKIWVWSSTHWCYSILGPWITDTKSWKSSMSKLCSYSHTCRLQISPLFVSSKPAWSSFSPPQVALQVSHAHRLLLPYTTSSSASNRTRDSCSMLKTTWLVPKERWNAILAHQPSAEPGTIRTKPILVWNLLESWLNARKV